MARKYIDRITVGEVLGYFRETIYGAGEPTSTIDAFPGQRYFDTAAQLEYVCISATISGGTVRTEWRLSGSGEEGSGVSPSASVEQTEDGAVITITDKTGTTTAEIYHGKDGSPGKNGTSVYVDTTEESWDDGGENIIEFSDGTKISIRNGKTGAKGDPGTSIYIDEIHESDDDGDENRVVFNDGTELIIRNGKSGTSVRVAETEESWEDGGENRIRFSDNHELIIRNGKTGAKGDPGKDYVLTDADKTEIAEQAAEAVYDEHLADVEWMAKKDTPDGPVVFEERVLIFDGTVAYLSQNGGAFGINTGIRYIVLWNDVVYILMAKTYDGEPYIGNARVAFGSTAPDTGEPFCLYGSFFASDTIAYVQKAAGEPDAPKLEVKINGGTFTYTRMPPQYLPKGVVKSVNGTAPDADGNVVVSASGGSGGASIDVTAEVGQTIVVRAVDGNGKPTAWEAAEYPYPMVEKEILPAVDFAGVYSSVFGAFMYDFPAADGAALESLAIGQEYTVWFDGVKYVCTGKYANLGGTLGVYIGNGAIVGNNTGEPFAFATATAGEPGLSFIGFDGNEHSARIVVREMAEEYSCLPFYIDVTGAGTDDDPYVCMTSPEKAMKAAQKGRLPVVRMLYNANGVEHAQLASMQYLTVTLMSFIPFDDIPAGWIRCEYSHGFGGNAGKLVLNLKPNAAGTYDVQELNI